MAYGVVATAGPCLVTVDASVSTVSEVVAHEVSGLATSGILDASSTKAQTTYSSNPFTSGTSTTSVAGDYIFGYAEGNSGAAMTPGSGFTIQAVGVNSDSEDTIQTSAGPISASFTPSTADVFTAGMMALKPL